MKPKTPYPAPASAARAHRPRRTVTVLLATTVTAVAVAGAVTLVSTASSPAPARVTLAASNGAVGVVVCPTVGDRLPAVPASARAEVERNLALLDRQVAEANQRLVDTVGQGGPDFVQNAILGPLASKRTATIDRIAIAIGRTAARPTGLESAATCTLDRTPGATSPAESAPVVVAPPPAAGAPAAVGRINCPAVRPALPRVPAQAAAEVERNLTLLDRQVAEANQRLVDTVGQGGPNFVRNAILGPLASKRTATLDRIAIAIGRHAARPTGLESLATCTVARA